MTYNQVPTNCKGSGHQVLPVKVLTKIILGIVCVLFPGAKFNEVNQNFNGIMQMTLIMYVIFD